MRIIRNKYIPLGANKAINLFGILFIKEKAIISDTLIRHETIHSEQIKELGYIFFYLIYVIEWIWWLIKLKNTHTAYHRVSFEREAYEHEGEVEYKRKHYAQWI